MKIRKIPHKKSRNSFAKIYSLDFSRVTSDSPEELKSTLTEHFQSVAGKMGVTLEAKSAPASTLVALIEKCAKKERAVLLIDEYDKALTRHLEDPQLTSANRNILHDVFDAIKSLQSNLRFLFVTGVSRFSKVSLFSGMNNLKDISLRSSYGELVGFTEQEIADSFKEHLSSLAQTKRVTVERLMDEMRDWYNGYSFDPFAVDGRVFNPWSVLNYLDTGRRKNYWFDSGTPTFAIQLIEERNFPIPEFETGIEAGDELETSSDVSEMPLTALLFQAGYLTIDSFDPDQELYRLGFPNEEVRRSLTKHLFLFFLKKKAWEAIKMVKEGRKFLEAGEFAKFFSFFNHLLAEIPYSNHIGRESYYQSMIYLFIRMLGFDISAEVATHRGCADLVVKTKSAVLVFEFKLNRSAKEALDQARERGYAERYRERGEVILIGANFSVKERKIDQWKKESL